MDKNNYIWIFGENSASTANNNSYYFWKEVVNINDDIDKYILFEKNEKTQKAYANLTEYEKKFVIWKNTRKHFKLYSDADMFFVSLSYKDVVPDKILFAHFNFIVKRPVIYLRHGTTGMKRTYYTGDYYWNNMFRFLSYNPEETDYMVKYNNFRRYQLHYEEYLPRYGQLVKKDECLTDKNQILWFLTWREYFGKNIETKLFTKSISNVLKSGELEEYLLKNDLTVKICVHQMFDVDTFKDIYKYSKKGLIEIVHSKDIDVMDELVKSRLLITDYSSVAYDFTLLNRPVLLYQPDLEVYSKTRDFYCKISDLNENNITTPEELISKLISEKCEVNPFFRKTLPEKIDYEYIKQNKHIHKLYNHFAELLRNRITIIGLSFYEPDDITNSTMSLAERLLEEGYLLEVISLYHPKEARFEAPLGLNMLELKWDNTPSKKDKLTRKLYSFKKNYHELNYDPKINLLHPYGGHYLDKLMKNSRSKTIISTRESTHLFLNRCSSDKVKNKIYFLHTPIECESPQYGELLDKLKEIKMEKSIFVSENDAEFYKNKLGIEPASKIILNSYLTESQIAKPNLESEFLDENCRLKKLSEEELKQTDPELSEEYELLNLLNNEKKETYCGISILNLDKYYRKDINKLVDFGNYLKDNSIENIKIDVIGDGDYVYEFMQSIVENDLLGYINYLGTHRNMTDEIRNHDFLIDFCENPSYNTHYLQGALNYKKVFCIKNPKSEEIFEDIPDTFIESYDALCKQINNLDKISLRELSDYFNIVASKFNDGKIEDDIIDYIVG